MSKDAFYFKHDIDAQGDEKMNRLLTYMGPEGTGIYWLLIERLYKNQGSIQMEYPLLEKALNSTSAKIRKVAEKYQLFYFKHGRLRSRRVDRELDYRREIREQAAKAGTASGRARRERSFNGRSTDPEPGEERRGEREEITDNNRNGAPSAVDFSDYRVPFGKRKGVYVINMPVDECQTYLRSRGLSREFKAALEWRIALKKSERTGRSIVPGFALKEAP